LLKDLVLSTENLPSNVNELRLLVSQQQEELSYYKSEVSRLDELVRHLRRQHFAPTAERIPKEQLGLFNEAESIVATSLAEDGEQTVKAHNRRRPKRNALPKDLPRERVVITLEGRDRICPHDGHELKEIGEDVSEQMDIVPAQMKIIETIRKKYACPICEQGVKIAPLPAKPIPKSIASAGLLAFIAVSKYVDALPLYRLENILLRAGVGLSRSTLSLWMIKVADLLMPLFNLMEEELLTRSYLCCDETRVQVLKEVGKKPTTLSYMWVRGTHGPGPPIVLFDYDPTRSAQVPLRLLEGFGGYVQVDAYQGYDEFFRKNSGAIRVGCLAHVRRKFEQSLKASKDTKGKATEGLSFITKLYQIERYSKNLNHSEKELFQVRQNKSKPVLDKFRTWLDAHKDSVAPKSLLGKAILYAHNEWPHLIRYVENGALRPDNNFVENAIRPFAVGRKNWLFSDSVGGAKASATIYSIIETAKANGLEPYWYLRKLFEELPRATTLGDVTNLLPWILPEEPRGR
jgi:transposase